MGLSKQIRAGLSVMLMTATILGSQVAATKDMEAYAHHTGSSTTLKSSKVRKPSTTPAPNRFNTKPYRGQKMYKSAREIVNQAFKDAGINGKRKKYFSAARNVQAQEIAHLEKVVRHFESRLRRMNLSPNAQGRKEIEAEAMRYFDTKILPRFKRLRKAEIASSVHKSWSYMNDTGNYSSMYDYYISPERVSEMYFKYLRERLRITTALRTRTSASNTLPDQVFKAYYGSIKRVHLLYQQYKAGEYVLAIAKYEHYKDAYGADTLMALARGRTKKGYVPVVNLRDFRDQVPDVQATMKLNLIFGGRETKHTRKIENKLKAELQQEYNKSIVEVIAMAAEDAVARLAKEGYHYYNNRYVVLSGLFDFLIFDVDILNAPTKARLATKADELRSITGIKKGASVADDVPTPRSRTSNATDDLDNARSTKKRRTSNIPCTSNASVGLPIIAGLNPNGEVLIASSVLPDYSGYSGVVSDVGGLSSFEVARKLCGDKLDDFNNYRSDFDGTRKDPNGKPVRPFDSDTILSWGKDKGIFQKTNLPKQDGKSVYKALLDVPNTPIKKGQYYYLDNLHGNLIPEIEIFDKRGKKHLGTMDIEGKKITGGADKTKRPIK